MDFEEMTSQDRRIMTWDKNDYDGFIHSFSEDEMKEMLCFLTGNPLFPAYYFSDDVLTQHPDWIVYDYVRRWLYTQLEEGTISGTRELFEVAMAMT